MRLFGEAGGPRVFHIPACADFSASLAEGLLARIPESAPPEAMARVQIFTNTRRAARSFSAAIRSAVGATGFAPDIRVFGELGADPRLSLDAPQAVDPLVRRLRMTRIVQDILERADGRLGPPSAAPALADLVSLMVDELQEHQVDIESLDAAATEDHAAHWEISRLVLQTAQQEWRAWAEAHLSGALDPMDRQMGAIEATIAAWERNPPQHPVIAAGSTASRPGALRLLAAIARLPQGAVILPGLDPDLDASAKANITAEHPQSAMRSFVDALDMSSEEIRDWRPTPSDPECLRLRAELVAESLRPAPVTDAWRAQVDRIGTVAAKATEGLTLIEAPDARREAEAAALAIREALSDPSANVALVTPDRTLARRVATELSRAGVDADDSGGRPLSLTPPGAFLNLLADWEVGQHSSRDAALRLLALLKHPMCAAGASRGGHLAAVRWMEIAALRQSTPATSFSALRSAIATWEKERDSRKARAEAALALVERVERALAPIAALQGGLTPLADRITAHRAAATALASLGVEEGEPEGSPPLPPSLWRDADGEAAHEALLALWGAAPAFGDSHPHDYAQLLSAHLAAESARESVRSHPRLAIYGPLEARVQRADRVILAGLDEGVWPEAPQLDPWFSRPMRRAAGLPDVERRLGLSAHDFAQGMGAREVVLTRALKRDGAATVASRWVQRLGNLLQGAAPDALKAAKTRGEAYIRIASQYGNAPKVPPAIRPAPRPAVSARPRRLSVTRIETLIRDPYAVYAEKVLGLRAIPPIGRIPDARERGSAAHKAMELFTRATLDAFPDDPWPIWARSVEEALKSVDAWPATQALWRRRLERVAPWFLSSEAERRAAGRPLGVEVSGRLTFAAPEGDFTLTAKADRIDLSVSAVYTLYDYKTGALPSEPQVAAFAKQLPLEAAIAQAGGFEGLAPAPAAGLVYIRLGGDGDEKSVAQKTPAAEQASSSLAQLKDLIAAYDAADTPYLSRSRPERIAHESDYDHLARVAEWSSADGEETGS